MLINQTIIEDTYAEVFELWGGRLWCTALNHEWALLGAREATGYGSSIIGCDVEAGVEAVWAEQTVGPDGRPGYRLLFLGRQKTKLISSLQNRVGQCLLTCPTVHVYNALQTPSETFPLGEWVRYFGDQFEKEDKLGGREVWRIPVMDGECLIEKTASVSRMIAGGLFLIVAATQEAGLAAASRAVKKIGELEGVITPFPGGIVRSGSRVGSRYEGVPAATNAPYCPTLKSQIDSKLMKEAKCVYEIVINGVDIESVKRAMRAGMLTACGQDILSITASHYDGKLGDIQIGLRDLLGEVS